MNNTDVESCNCIEGFISEAKRNRSEFQGLAVVVKPDGSCHKGLLAVMRPVIYGGRKRTMIFGFRFCPFCGKRLEKEIVSKGETIQ